MKKSRAFFPLLLLLFLANLSYPQTENTNYPVIPSMDSNSDPFYLQFTEEKRDLNKVREPALRRFLSVAGMKTEWIDALIHYRKVHGEIQTFPEIESLGFTPESMDLIKKIFYLDSTRKSAQDILAASDSEENQLENIDYYYDFLITPLNLNTSDLQTLSVLPGMDPDKAARIIRYREKNSIGELLELTNAGVSREDLLTLSPFITIKPPSDKGLAVNIAGGYQSSAASNSGEPVYTTRFKADTSWLKAYFGTTTVSNTFPEAYWGDILASARYNLEMNLNNIKIIGGHYRLKFGQNLLFGSSFLPVLSDWIPAPSASKSDAGLSAYYRIPSLAEEPEFRDYFSGLGAQYQYDPLELLGFYPKPRLALFYSAFGNDAHSGLTNQLDYGANLSANIPLGDTRVGFTASRQERLDNKFNDTGLSFYYQSSWYDLILISGEAAKFGGLCGVQSVSLILEPIQASLTGFYSETNYNAPNGSGFFGDVSDCAGIFGSLGYRQKHLQLSFYAEFSGKSTNTIFDQRYQGSAVYKLPFAGLWLNNVELEARLKYSDLSEEQNIRTMAGGTVEFFNKKWECGVKWAGILNLTRNESGNLYSLRAGFHPFRWIAADFQYQYFQSESYYSRLYNPSMPLYIGDFNSTPYYGFGSEYSFRLKSQIPDILEASLGISYNTKNSGNYLFNAFAQIYL